jgi:outer membrane biosynthesis protein TonB
MAITDEQGNPVDVEAANLSFARAMTPRAEDAQPIAPEPPKKLPDAPKPKPEKKPAPKRKPKTISAPVSPVVKTKRVKAGSDILMQFAGLSETAYMTTGDPAWEADTKLFTETAPAFGQALADVADHNQAFAKMLDAEGGVGAGLSYLALIGVTSQITRAVVDNHNGRPQLQHYFQAAKLKLKMLLSGRRKSHARSVKL